MATEKLGIKIVKNPPESKLTDLGVRSWPKWGCSPSKFPWTFSSNETCYLLKGKVKVYVEGSDEAVEIGAGDLVEFPKGMKCTWDVSETVDKHYYVEVYYKTKRHPGIIRASSETMLTEKSGIKIVKNPPESKLTDLGVRSWPKWGCPPSKFPWTYSSKETCYLLKGKVKVYPEGSDEAVEIAAGDLVEFPKGMNCTWDVSETVDKHYLFE